jgi:hypothetical protein
MHKLSTISPAIFMPLAALLLFACKNVPESYGSKPIQHDQWTLLLQKHVSSGKVNYKGFTDDKEALQSYLDLLSSHHPDENSWSREEQMAYWINAYNAFTIKLVLDHYPVKSIKDIKKGIPFVNSVWDLKFITIEGRTYDLNNIEHNILRSKFDDPRIHFAINCASVSCPELINEAYVAEKLDVQLERAAHRFFADPEKNKLQADRVDISRIFLWFGGDFKKASGDLISYIRQYTDIAIESDAEIRYLEYDWNLNE